ncbi:MAG: F0F1 ATP synthase subunit epsilon [Deltaproteobacteria bacterium]|nr:F0F1 ATP synthase subunit epsilon [Deltaproteobacteria bacterium]
MANKILLEVVTPEKLLVNKEVDIVVATGVDGEFGVLYGHVPFLATLDIGELRFKDGNATEYAAIAGGFAEVTAKKVTILAEAAELARDIDVDRASRARERAEQRITQTQAEALDFARSEAALKRAMLRMRVAGRTSAAA